MIYIVSGTDRKGSRTLQVSQFTQSLYKAHGIDAEVIDLRALGLKTEFESYGDDKPEALAEAVEKLNASKGIHFVVPEYNGSYPGVLKFFIDHWAYPLTFEKRPVAFTGLGFRWGGLRPIEHLQGVMGYRNAYQFPERVFLQNITSVFQDGRVVDETVLELMQSQVTNFVKFCDALKSAQLTAISK
jgi:chromate reductase